MTLQSELLKRHSDAVDKARELLQHAKAQLDIADEIECFFVAMKIKTDKSVRDTIEKYAPHVKRDPELGHP